jgi:hypothetical protein
VIEDDVKQVLASRAEQAPVRADGRAMLERVGRRERAQVRGRAVAAAAAVAVLAGGGALWSSRTAPTHREVAANPAVSPTSSGVGQSPQPQATSRLRSASWQDLQFEVPSSWTVVDTGEVHPHPSGALIEGPFLGTLRTSRMCLSNPDGSGSCGRSNGILDRKPEDGVVAWIDAARSAGNATDPGPGTDACPPGGKPFHSYRQVTGDGITYRVVVDGCAYGPRAQEYLDELAAVASSVRAG